MDANAAGRWHVHWHRVVSVSGPWTGNRYMLTGIVTRRCRCGSTLTNRERVSRA